jgi:hypothetical protein
VSVEGGKRTIGWVKVNKKLVLLGERVAESRVGEMRGMHSLGIRELS